MIEVELELKVEGHKSSEGDGRTAADIERELEERKRELLEERPAEEDG